MLFQTVWNPYPLPHAPPYQEMLAPPLGIVILHPWANIVASRNVRRINVGSCVAQIENSSVMACYEQYNENGGKYVCERFAEAFRDES